MHRPTLAPVRLAAAAALLLLGAACTAPEETAPEPTTAAAPSEAPAASDAGGASEAGGAPEAYAVTPPPQPMELANACTGEGMHRAAIGQSAQPALPERDGSSLEIVMAGLDTEGRVVLTAAVDRGDPVPVQPAAVGDSVAIQGWTLSVTSICEDEVEFDLVN